MGLFMLCARPNDSFSALPCKHNEQAVLNLTMVVKHSVVHAVYLHITGGSGVSNVEGLASQGQGSEGQQKMKNCCD